MKAKFKKGDRVRLPSPCSGKGTVIATVKDRSLDGELLPFVLVRMDERVKTQYGYVLRIAFYQPFLTIVK